GPGQFVGNGVLLHTVDGGKTWESIAGTNFDAGAGTFSCFSDMTWNGVGPIHTIHIAKQLQPDGSFVARGWVTSCDGVYFTTNAGSPSGAWRRTTPLPDG